VVYYQNICCTLRRLKLQAGLFLDRGENTRCCVGFVDAGLIGRPFQDEIVSNRKSRFIQYRLIIGGDRLPRISLDGGLRSIPNDWAKQRARLESAPTRQIMA
jgi:hypothetical protein